MAELIERTYAVTGMTCGHCERAVTEEVAKVAGIRAVAVDLQGGTVTVTGTEFRDEAVRAAVDEAGYEVTS